MVTGWNSWKYKDGQWPMLFQWSIFPLLCPCPASQNGVYFPYPFRYIKTLDKSKKKYIGPYDTVETIFYYFKGKVLLKKISQHTVL